jgi:predicted RND superfamily exporter protein
VVLVFRHFRPTMTVLAGLLIGVAWLVGLAAVAHVRINFLNFVVLPITFGIGVDYSVNIIQRYRLEGRGSLARVIRETGGAVSLCSSTTVIGSASLFVADNHALAGFGLLASLGEVSCLTAALVALPAWLMGREASILKDPGEAQAL